MALEILMTGTGSVGDIQPGWSVQEGATPVAIGDTGSATGSVSFGARATDNSLLAINNDVITTIGGVGNLHGVVQSVSETGAAVRLTHGTVLDKTNLDLDMPALVGGDAATALDYFEQKVLRKARTNKTVGDFYSLNGHNYSFIQDADGLAEYQPATTLSTDFVYTIPGESTIAYNYEDIRHSVDVDSFVRLNNKVYADGALGKMFFSSGGFNNGIIFDPYEDLSENISSKVFFKTFLNGGDTNFNIFGKPISLANEWYLECNVNISYVNDSITLQGIYAPGGDSTPFLVTQSISGLDTTQELAVFIHFYTRTSPNNKYYIDVKVCNTSNYSTFVGVDQEFSYGMAPIFDYFKIQGNIRSLYQLVNSNTYVANSCAEYEIASDIEVDLVDTPVNQSILPATARKGVFWEYLQMACAARLQEIYVHDDVIGVRDIGARKIEFKNYTVSPTVTPTSTLSGRQVNIPYTDAYFIGETIDEFGDRVKASIYNAADDNNNIISVEVGEVTETPVKFNVNPITVFDPVPTDTLGPSAPGTYFVTDSEGILVLAAEWLAYGGKVTAKIDPEDAGAILVTVTGPTQELTVAGGPYKLSATYDDAETATLNIAGTGVYFGEKQLELVTGLDPVKYTRATVNTINNPFVNSVRTAYDRGVWASLKASGPVVTMSATIPTRDVNNMGELSGSLFDYRLSTYRITTDTIGPAGTSLNAERFVTVADVDALWAGQDVVDYDDVWGSYESQDQIIFPYLEA
jgi:hypothetical protein